MTRPVPDSTGEFALAHYDSKAYEKAAYAKTGAGVLFGFSGYTTLSSGQWIHIHDSAGVPNDGAIPKIILWVPAAGNFSADFGIYGRDFSLGLVICNSTTGPTKTAGAADTWFNTAHK